MEIAPGHDAFSLPGFLIALLVLDGSGSGPFMVLEHLLTLDPLYSVWNALLYSGVQYKHLEIGGC